MFFISCSVSYVSLLSAMCETVVAKANQYLVPIQNERWIESSKLAHERWFLKWNYYWLDSWIMEAKDFHDRPRTRIHWQLVGGIISVQFWILLSSTSSSFHAFISWQLLYSTQISKESDCSSLRPKWMMNCVWEKKLWFNIIVVIFGNAQ